MSTKAKKFEIAARGTRRAKGAVPVGFARVAFPEPTKAEGKAGNKHDRRAPKVRVPEAIGYDAEDIEEANRFGAALCRQHAP